MLATRSVRPRDLVTSADAISLAANKAAIHLNDLDAGAATAHLQEAITHAQTFARRRSRCSMGSWWWLEGCGNGAAS